MKRSRESAKFWKKKIDTLFKDAPKAQLTQYRHQAVRNVLTGTYKWIEGIDKKEFIEMLTNASYVERLMRQKTEGRQVEIKRQLEQEFILHL